MITDETSLWKHYTKSRSAKYRNLIAENYLNLVRFVVEKIYYNGSSFTKEDFFNTGILGLLDAVEKFDASKKTKFATYAYIRIYGSIMDYIRSVDWTPRSVKGKLARIEEARKALADRGINDPGDTQMADELNMSMKDYYEMQDGLQINKIYSLEDFYDSSDGKGGADDIFVQPEQSLEMREQLASAIDRALDEKERVVLSMYYYEECTLKEISDVMKLTEARISQIHAKAISKMKQYLTVEKAAVMY